MSYYTGLPVDEESAKTFDDCDSATWYDEQADTIDWHVAPYHMLNKNVIDTPEVGSFIENAEDHSRVKISITRSDLRTSNNRQNVGAEIMGNQVFLNVWDSMRAHIMQRFHLIFSDFSSQIQQVVLVEVNRHRFNMSNLDKIKHNEKVVLLFTC